MSDYEETDIVEEELANPSESKSDKFKRIAAPRVNKALKAIECIGNCSNRSAYEYSQEQIEAMFEALEAKLAETKAMFVPKSEKVKDTFSF